MGLHQDKDARTRGERTDRETGAASLVPSRPFRSGLLLWCLPHLSPRRKLARASGIALGLSCSWSLLRVSAKPQRKRASWVPGPEKAFERVKSCQVVFSRAFCQVCSALEAWAQREGCAQMGKWLRKGRALSQEQRPTQSLSSNITFLLYFAPLTFLCFPFLTKIDQCIDHFKSTPCKCMT